MTARLGHTVLYTLTAEDAEAINQRRRDYEVWHTGAGVGFNTGHIAHVGNHAEEGGTYPALVVATWPHDPALPRSVNLQVHLDGNDMFWATSRTEGDGPGHWTRLEPRPLPHPADWIPA